MKKLTALVLALMLVVGLAACGDPSQSSDGEVSVFYYTYSDAYISSVRSSMDKLLTEAGIKYQNYDANGNQTTQTEQVTTAIAKGSKALIVNVVDTGSDDAAKTILDMAKAKNIPVIFFNRSVAESVVSSYDKSVFIGTDYEMAGHMQGEMIGNYLLEHFAQLDLNGDGKISYVMFKGQEGNMEAIARTQYGVEDADKILTAAGKPALEFYDSSNTKKYLVDQNGAWQWNICPRFWRNTAKATTIWWNWSLPTTTIWHSVQFPHCRQPAITTEAEKPFRSSAWMSSLRHRQQSKREQ